MSHFSLLGPRTNRSHHEADSTAGREKKNKQKNGESEKFVQMRQ